MEKSRFFNCIFIVPAQLCVAAAPPSIPSVLCLLLALSSKHSFTHRHSFPLQNAFLVWKTRATQVTLGLSPESCQCCPPQCQTMQEGKLEGSIACSGIRNPVLKMHLLAFQTALFGRGLSLLFKVNQYVAKLPKPSNLGLRQKYNFHTISWALTGPGPTI